MLRIVLSIVLLAGVWNSSPAADDLTRREWQVDGVVRLALVYAPAEAKTTPSPLVFVFHGHGGTMRNTAGKFAIQRHWPEAIAVYMQGLNTPGAITDPEGKRPGWQRTFGDQNDRDLKFFDTVLATLKREYRVDEQRVYATGHSNGGAFTYLLWSARGEVFAAVAPSAAVARLKDLTPKPALHLAGEKDALVRFAWQRRMIDQLREVNGCAAGQPQGTHLTLYPSASGTPLTTYIHPGGHELPADAPAVIVKFFQQHHAR